MRLRCPFLLLLSSLVPLRALSDSSLEPVDTLLTLDEVAVSGIKYGTRPSSQPVSSTIINRKMIDNLDIINIKQFSDLAPNFFMPEYGSRITSTIYMRGLGSRIDQPTVGLNIDNIPVLNKNNFDFDIENLEKIEIIRGAQSTMYGRSSMAGVMNLYTISPMHYQGFKTRITYGSSNLLKASIGWYGLLRNNTGLSINGALSGNSGYWVNMYNGEKIDKEKSAQLNGRISHIMQNGWVIDNSLSINFNKQNGYPYESIETHEINYNDTCFYKRFGVLDGLTMNGKINGWINLMSVTSVQYLDDNMTLDQDFLPFDYFTLSQKTREIGITQDFTLRGRKEYSGYSWISGAYFWGRYGSMKAPVLFKDYGITHLIEHYRNEANPYYPIAWDDRNFLIDTYFRPSTAGLSLYHESLLKTDRWKFSAGIRFDYEKARLSYESQISTSYTIYEAATSNIFDHRDVEIDDRDILSRDFLQLLPKLTILYQWGTKESYNLFLNLSKGYKPGGFNTQMFSDVMQQRLRQQLGLSMLYDVDDIVSYKPEKTWNVELGFHGSFFNNNLTLSASTFYIDVEDQQLTMFPAGTTTGRIMANAGRSRSVGAEISSFWQLNKKWDISLTAGLADARFIKFNDGIDDYSGHHIPYAPLLTTFMQFNFLSEIKGVNLWFEKLGFTLSSKGTGPIWWNENNSKKQSFYELVDFTFRVIKGPMTIEGWLKNITSTRYSTFYFLSIGHEFVQRGRPFNCGLTLRWEF